MSNKFNRLPDEIIIKILSSINMTPNVKYLLELSKLPYIQLQRIHNLQKKYGNVLNAIHDNDPNSVLFIIRYQDYFDYIPYIYIIQELGKLGNEQLIELVINEYEKKYTNFNYDLLVLALASAGHLDLVNKYFPLSKLNVFDIYQIAMKYNQRNMLIIIDIIKHLINNNTKYTIKNLKYPLFDNDYYIYFPRAFILEDLPYVFRKWDIIRELMELGYTLTTNDIIYAIYDNQFDLIDDILESYDPENLPIIAYGAAMANNLDLLNEMLEREVIEYQEIANYAAKGGHLNIIMDMINRNGGTLNYQDIANNAAEGGHLDIIIDMINRNGGYLNYDRIIEIAIINNYIHILIYLLENGYNNYNILLNSKLYNSYPLINDKSNIIDIILKYKQNIPIDILTRVAIVFAIQRDYLILLKLLDHIKSRFLISQNPRNNELYIKFLNELLKPENKLDDDVREYIIKNYKI